MRFLVDECMGPTVARWLRGQGHEVFSVFDQARGMDDDNIIDKAYAENWILITGDKGFGESVYRDRRLHCGVVLLRLEDERTANKIIILARLLRSYADRIAGSFLVVTENTVRFARR